jgi:hypothetical protein
VTDIIQHNVVRSVEINLRMTLSAMPDLLIDTLVSRISEWANDARATLIPHEAQREGVELDYTLQIKHLADHLIRSFHPTPF